MRGSSRSALLALEGAFNQALGESADRGALAEDLFAILGVVDSSATLRRALADPSRDAQDKRGLIAALFGSKVGAQAVALAGEAAAQRWSDERDLTDSLESLAVQALLGQAESEGRIDDVEDQLFRFERIVAADAGLRDTLSLRNQDQAGKAGLVESLLTGKVHPETLRLARQAVTLPRGRRLDASLGHYLTLASRRLNERAALVTVAHPLDEQQHARLRSALESIYGCAVKLQVVLDPTVLGGIRVQIGDEVVDGTILRRLDEARRQVTGN